MGLKLKFDITGRTGIERKLGDITASVSVNGAADGALAAAEVYAKGLKERMPRATGGAAEHVVFGIIDAEPGKVTAAAGPDRRYWGIRFKEYGFTDPAGVKHSPQEYGGPFARTTYDEDKDTAIEAAGEAMGRHVK